MPQVRLRKPQAILFDIGCTTMYTTFMDKTLAYYVRKNVRAFLSNNWTNGQVIRDVDMARAAAAKNKTFPQIATEPPEAVWDSVTTLMNWCLDNDQDCLGLAQLRFHIWFDAYQKGLLTTSIYSDVAIQMKRWRCDYDIKLYVVSHGWSEANKVFLSRTNQGDMTLLIDGYFDTRNGQWKDLAAFRKVLDQIGVPSRSVVLFTKSGAMARAASSLGILPILVTTHKKCYDALNEEEKKMAIIRTMNEVEFE